MAPTIQPKKPLSIRPKSGDSKLQDGHAARERDQAETTHSPEQLPELLQDAAEQKKMAGVTREEWERTQAALERMTSIIEKQGKMLEDQVSVNARLENVKRVRGADIQIPRCGTCQQHLYMPTTKVGVCKGDHVTVNVVPPSRDLWPDFQGIIRNGVTYLGMSVMPREMADDVVASTRRWEEMKRSQQRNNGLNNKMPRMLSAPVFGPDQKHDLYQ